MLSYADDDWDGQAVEPGLPPLTHDLDYDYGAIEPERTRLSAKMARAAVAEFVATGKRPTCVTWDQ
jgi:Immunity protein Imm1